jgi:hypothetical protein
MQMAKQTKTGNNGKSSTKESRHMIRHHREYSIEHRNGKYVAKPLDGDELKICSDYLPRVMSAIDTFWDGLSQIPAVASDKIIGPRWLREWLSNPTNVIDVDDAYSRGAC